MEPHKAPQTQNSLGSSQWDRPGSPEEGLSAGLLHCLPGGAEPLL